MNDADDHCAKCNRAIYWSARKDSVGRWTSEGDWRHFDAELNDEHQAVPT